MDILGLVSLPNWLIYLLTPILTFCLYTLYKQSFFTRHGIKQKPTTFIVGDFVQATKQGNVYFNKENCSKYGKVYGMYFANVPCLVVNDPDVLQHIYVKEFSNFANRSSSVEMPPEWQGVLTRATGSHWKFLRSVISPAFSAGKLRQMDPYMLRSVNTLLEIFEEKRMAGEDIDLDPLVHAFTMDIICSVGFGMDVDAQRNPNDPFVKHGDSFNKFNSASPLLLIAFFLPDLRMLQKLFRGTLLPKDSYEFFKSATTTAFEERKKSDSKHKDLLQVLINSQRENGNSDALEDGPTSFEDYKKRGLTDKEILINSIEFIVAGNMTTAALLLWLFVELTSHPECQDRLREEIEDHVGQDQPTYDAVVKMSYLDQVIKETLRVHPPVDKIVRIGTKDTEVNGTKIPKDVMILSFAKVLHFMDEYWDSPNEFRPERFAPENKANINEFAYIPFGNGPRNCVGVRLALLEVKMALVCILRKYRVLRSDKMEVPMPSVKMGIDKPGKPVLIKLEKL